MGRYLEGGVEVRAEHLLVEVSPILFVAPGFQDSGSKILDFRIQDRGFHQDSRIRGRDQDSRIQDQGEFQCSGSNCQLADSTKPAFERGFVLLVRSIMI